MVPMANNRWQPRYRALYRLKTAKPFLKGSPIRTSVAAIQHGGHQSMNDYGSILPF